MLAQLERAIADRDESRKFFHLMALSETMSAWSEVEPLPRAIWKRLQKEGPYQLCGLLPPLADAAALQSMAPPFTLTLNALLNQLWKNKAINPKAGGSAALSSPVFQLQQAGLFPYLAAMLTAAANELWELQAAPDTLAADLADPEYSNLRLTHSRVQQLHCHCGELLHSMKQLCLLDADDFVQHHLLPSLSLPTLRLSVLIMQHVSTCLDQQPAEALSQVVKDQLARLLIKALKVMLLCLQWTTSSCSCCATSRLQLLRSPYASLACSIALMVSSMSWLLLPDYTAWFEAAEDAANSSSAPPRQQCSVLSRQLVGDKAFDYQLVSALDSQWQAVGLQLAADRHGALPLAHQELLLLTGISSKAVLWAATVTVRLHFSEAVVDFTEAAAAHLALCTATLSQQDRAPVGSEAGLVETHARLFLSSIIILHWADHDLAGGAPGISNNYMAAPTALRCGCRAFAELSQACDSTSLATQHQQERQQQQQLAAAEQQQQLAAAEQQQQQQQQHSKHKEQQQHHQHQQHCHREALPNRESTSKQQQQQHQQQRTQEQSPGQEQRHCHVTGLPPPVLDGVLHEVCLSALSVARMLCNKLKDAPSSSSSSSSKRSARLQAANGSGDVPASKQGGSSDNSNKHPLQPRGWPAYKRQLPDTLCTVMGVLAPLIRLPPAVDDVILPLPEPAWRQNISQLCAALEQCSRLVAAGPNSEPLLLAVLQHLESAVLGGVARIDARQGVLLQAAAAAAIGSKEQLQLYSLLCTLAKVAVRIPPQPTNPHQSSAFAAITLSAATMVRVHLKSLQTAASASRDADNTEAPSASSAADSSSSSSAASAAEPEYAAAVSAGLVHTLPWVSLLGSCCLYWAQQLQLSDRPTPGGAQATAVAAAVAEHGHLQATVGSQQCSGAQQVLPTAADTLAKLQQYGPGGELPMLALVTGAVEAWSDLCRQVQLPALAGLNLTRLQQLLGSVFEELQAFEGLGPLEVQPDGGLSAVQALAGKLQDIRQALGSVAHKYACNNPCCGSLLGVSELQLVKGRSSSCSGCRTARYCSEGCMREHWKQHVLCAQTSLQSSGCCQQLSCHCNYSSSGGW